MTSDMPDLTTVFIPPSHIIGSGDTIKFDGNLDFVNKIQSKYGIDLTNKNLLNHLKTYGRLKLTANLLHPIWDAAPTEEQLDKIEKEELEVARAAFQAAKEVENIPEMKEQ